MQPWRPGIILQARYGSARLRGKALRRVGQWSILEHCIRRLRQSASGEVVLATTGNAEDDALTAIARRLGVRVFRGDRDDVLGRYVAAAEAFALDPVIRATGDNPFVDIHAPARLLAALRESDADYVRENGLPLGAAVEAVTLDALRRSAAHADEPPDREHVTTYLRRHSDQFRVRVIEAPRALQSADLSFTVDLPEDLRRVRELFKMSRSNLPGVARLIAAAYECRAKGVEQ